MLLTGQCTVYVYQCITHVQFMSYPISELQVELNVFL